MSATVLLWVLFNLFVLAMLALDLGVFHRRAHAVSLKEALAWSATWVGLALIFNAGLYVWRGYQPAMEFLTGYVIEKSLSLDNIFVFVIIFGYFNVPARYQHKVLFWGILGALVMRAFFIVAGIALIQKFHWIIYIFGLFLVITGIRMGLRKKEEIQPEKNPLLRLVRRYFDVTADYEGDRFFVRRGNDLFITPLFIVLILIETTDLIFAVDSIPAILAVTHDPFIVYSSNVFAILGLRALYFALAGIMDRFRYLHYGLAAVLVFVGVKMTISPFYKIPIGVALGVIVGILTVALAVSLARPAATRR